MSPQGKKFDVVAWGWSADSPDEAQRRAEESMQQSVARIAAGQGFPRGYGYHDRPPREEIIEEIEGTDGEVVGIVTRNSYGALVLNTSDLMFIDIDIPEEAPFDGFKRSIKSFFGLSAPTSGDRVRESIAEQARERPELTFRLYRTAAGFRCVVMNKRIKPSSNESEALLAAFGSDPLYVRLCKAQESFRARLTPKHWRCGWESPRERYPFDGAESEQRHRQWIADYDSLSQGYATCAFLEQFGEQRGVADFSRLIEKHDSLTRADSGFKLA